MTALDFFYANYLILGVVLTTLVGILTYWYLYYEGPTQLHTPSDGKISLNHIVVDFGSEKPSIVTGQLFQFKLKFYTSTMEPCRITPEDLKEQVFLDVKMISNWEDEDLDIGLSNEKIVGSNGGYFINFLLLSMERCQENENEVMVKFQVDRISDEIEIESFDKMQLNIIVWEDRLPKSPFIFVKNPSPLVDKSFMKKTSWTLK